MAVRRISVRDSRGNTHEVPFEGEPDVCPLCHRGIKPIDSKWDFFLYEQRVIERVLICPYESCQHLFIARYHLINGVFFLHSCVPRQLKPYSVPDELRAISPDFCDIYIEADKAEQLGLKLVCGPGYRKALEFLIKDYLTLQQTTEEAKKKIADSPLMACIKEFVTDSRVRTTAERATWLGNDETHYIRKWEDKDLEDMKRLITLTGYWIQSEHLTKSAVAEMPQGKK